MSRLKITPGQWFVGAQNDMLFVIDRAPAANNDYPDHNADRAVIAHVHDEARGHDGIANARLIAEAGTVANETGLMPRELLAQRDALFAAAELALLFLNREALPKEAEVRAALTAAIARVRGEA